MQGQNLQYNLMEIIQLNMLKTFVFDTCVLNFVQIQQKTPRRQSKVLRGEKNSQKVLNINRIPDICNVNMYIVYQVSLQSTEKYRRDWSHTRWTPAIPKWSSICLSRFTTAHLTAC